MPAVREDISGPHVWLVLFKASRAVQAHDLRSIEGLGLGFSDFVALEALLHLGPLTVGALGKRVLLTSGSMTAAVDRLVARSLVERKDAPGDRRARVVALTPKGRTLITKAFAKHAKSLERACEALDKAERATLVRLLKKLGKHAQSTLEK